MAIAVMIMGAGGKMGREVVKAVHEAADMSLIGAVDPSCAGEDAGELAGVGFIGAPVYASFEEALAVRKPTVIVDFTQPDTVGANVVKAVENGIHAVVGTTGLSGDAWNDIDVLAKKHGVGVIHAPNFAIGAVLMMRFAQEAAAYFDKVEIIELHHDQKHDAPSGTALYTAQLIRDVKEAAVTTETADETEVEVLAGARGGDLEGIKIHSVRLPGFVAHQEVLFGLPGQTLTLRHDSLDRQCFMPGVLLAVRKAETVRGVIIGLEKVL